MSAIKLHNLKIKGRELWWHEYRRRKYRLRRRITFEMAIRDIFKKCSIEYSRNGSIAGLKQIMDHKTTIPQRVALFLVFCLMCGIGGYFFWYFWFGSLASPFLVNMETSMYPISNIEFPAIAICNTNIIGKRALIELEWTRFKTNVSSNITYSRLRQLGRLLDYSYNESVKSLLQQYLNIDDGVKYAPFVISTMKTLAPKCNEMLLYCMWAGKNVECESIFQTRRTNRGFCCTFNYVRYNKPDATSATPIPPAKRQLYPGFLYGLNIVIDPLVDDYSYVTRQTGGVETLIFDPTHYADGNSGRVSQWLVQPGHSMFLGLSSIKQIATPEVRKYNVQTRGCLFHNEREKEYKGMYSYSACIFNCRIKTINELCGCTPYTFPVYSDVPTCTLKELSCLDKYKEKLLLLYPIRTNNLQGLDREFQDSLYCPECYPDCEFTRHETRTTKFKFQTAYIKKFKLYDGDFKNFNVSDKCFVSIHQTSFHGTLNRLDVNAYWYELISSVGGVAGILLGISTIGVFEVLYFFIFKFLILIVKLCYKRIRY